MAIGLGDVNKAVKKSAKKPATARPHQDVTSRPSTRKLRARDTNTHPAGASFVDPLESAPQSPNQTNAHRERIRPWSASGLAKSGQSRKQQIGTDHTMSSAYSDDIGIPVFWGDFDDVMHLDGQWRALQERIEGLENKMRTMFLTPTLKLLQPALHTAQKYPQFNALLKKHFPWLTLEEI